MRRLRDRLGPEPLLKPLRIVLVRDPLQLPIVICLLIVATVFWVLPDTLEHTAISFEQRSVVHHLWHGTLTAGAALTLIGMLLNRRVAAPIEFGGLTLLIIALAVNLIALLSDGGAISGMALGIRSGLMIGLGVRAWLVLTQPTIRVRASPDA